MISVKLVKLTLLLMLVFFILNNNSLSHKAMAKLELNKGSVSSGAQMVYNLNEDNETIGISCRRKTAGSSAAGDYAGFKCTSSNPNNQPRLVRTLDGYKCEDTYNWSDTV